MSTQTPKPVVFLAFANDHDDRVPKKTLRNLPTDGSYYRSLSDGVRNATQVEALLKHKFAPPEPGLENSPGGVQRQTAVVWHETTGNLQEDGYDTEHRARAGGT